MHAQTQVTIEAQGSLVKIKTSGLVRPFGISTHTRSKVSIFTKSSRKRLLDLMARFDLKNAVKARPVVFLTITYGQKFPSPLESKAHLEALKKRLTRFAPECSAIWRMEFQKRGAIHYHLVVFNLPYLPKDDFARWWHEIVGDEFADNSTGMSRPPFTRIESIASPRRAFHYVSKYIAKYDQVSPSDTNLPTEADDLSTDALELGTDELAPSGFIIESYLDASPKELAFVGRFWGIINAENLPFATLYITVLPFTQGVRSAFFDFRRLMAKKWKRANKNGTFVGATIYAWNCAERWWDVFFTVLGEAIGNAF